MRGFLFPNNSYLPVVTAVMPIVAVMMVVAVVRTDSHDDLRVSHSRSSTG